MTQSTTSIISCVGRRPGSWGFKLTELKEEQMLGLEDIPSGHTRSKRNNVSVWRQCQNRVLESHGDFLEIRRPCGLGLRSQGAFPS